MNKTFKRYMFAAASLAVLSIAHQVNCQTAVKCDPNVKDCAAAEQKAVAENNTSAVAARLKERSASGKHTPSFTTFAKNTDNSRYRSVKDTASSAADAAQTPGDDAQALAKKLANPVASLISLPFQSNFDFGMGPNKDGGRYTLNIQPVIPVKLNADWNVISRTILPIMAQNNVVGKTSQFGLGDTVQSFFFSPNKTEPFIWGLGPQFLIPTATSQYLGTQKLGLGITGLILKQKGHWTVGTLLNHMWSVAGKSTRADVSLTYFQPFISYTTKTAWTINVNTEMTYDWTAKVANIPVHLTVSKLVRFGKQPVSIGGALRCWAHSAPGGPQWCGFRLLFTPLFPKK